MDKTEESAQPILLVISGPSGVGKDSVIQHLKENIINCHFTITATTRDRRPGEIDGKDYIFLDEASFSEKISLDRSLVGSTLAELESVNAGLENEHINAQAALSRITDSNIADEVLNLSKEATLAKINIFSVNQENELKSRVINLLG